MREKNLVADLINDLCIEVLIGNTQVGTFSHDELVSMGIIVECEEFISNISMPKLSSNAIERLCERYKKAIPKTSKKEMFSELLLKTENINQFLSELFSYQSFNADKLQRLRQKLIYDSKKEEKIKKFHSEMVRKIVNYINEILVYSYLYIDDDLAIQLVDREVINIKSDKINSIPLVKQSYEQMYSRINNNDLKGAATLTQTLL